MAQEEEPSFSYDLHEREDIDWGMKFGVNEAVDFQTE